MTNPLLESNELLEYVSKDELDYTKIREIVYKLFSKHTGLDGDKNLTEFYAWLHENTEYNRVPIDDNSYRAMTHPLFARQVRKTEFPMFIDLHNKISTLSNHHCLYCGRGLITKSISIMPLDISPIAQSSGNTNRKKSRKVKAFKKAINNHFLQRESEFADGCKLCISILFIFGKDETDKDCDNMAKALNDGLNKSLINDDVHIDHLNIMKLKTTFNKSYIIINIRESNLNKHHDVLIKNSHYEPKILTTPINLNEFLDEHE